MGSLCILDHLRLRDAFEVATHEATLVGSEVHGFVDWGVLVRCGDGGGIVHYTDDMGGLTCVTEGAFVSSCSHLQIVLFDQSVASKLV